MRTGIFFIWIFVLSAALYAGNDCDVTVRITHISPSNIKVTLIHDANCTLAIEELNATAPAADLNISEANATVVQKIVTLARSKLGSPYKEATAGPDTFDCSGFVYYVFKNNGIVIPRSSIDQAEAGTKLTRDAIEVGDLLFFDTSSAGHVNHSGIYLGNGEFIHASSGKAFSVTVSKLDEGFYKERFRWGVRAEPKP